MNTELQSQLTGEIDPQPWLSNAVSAVPRMRRSCRYNDPSSLTLTNTTDMEHRQMPEGAPNQSGDAPCAIPASELNDIDALVRNYRSGILRFALSRVRDRDLAETVTQDCLMRAFRSRNEFRGGCSVRTWLFTIATNLIRDYTRTKRFRFWRDVDAVALTLGDVRDRVPCGQRSPEATLLAKEQLARMWSVVDSLPRRQKQVLFLRFAEEMKLSEIAGATGMTMSAIKTHLHRGVRTIRARMAEQRKRQSRKTETGSCLLSPEPDYELDWQLLACE
jgi:RNA polymerase sigma-70 factor (ECF subfamily)